MLAPSRATLRYLTLFAALVFLALVYRIGTYTHYAPGDALKSCIRDSDLALRAQLAKQPIQQQSKDLRHLFGLPDLLDDPTNCYNVTGRLRLYGYDNDSRVDDSLWNGRRWGEEQQACALSNHLYPVKDLGPPRRLPVPEQNTTLELGAPDPMYRGKERTAVVLRTTADFDWAGDVIAHIRSLIIELSLESGGLYEVFILVQVKDKRQHIFRNPDLYDRILRRSVPPEFRDIAYLWNENLAESWYSQVPEHKFIHQAYQALQLFAFYLQPHFDYYWQFEMDFRSSGPHLRSLERIAQWARAQPRLHLTNMNAAWYIPSLQGSWADMWALMNETLWTPSLAAEVASHGTAWGIDEEADLITLAPIVDVRRTHWLWKGMLHNDPYQTRKNNLPHFAAPVSMTRTSRRLLRAMHHLQHDYGYWLASEATMETTAYRKGFKAVHAQHPVFYNGTVPDDRLDWLFNAGPPHNLGGGTESQYNWESVEHGVLERLSWWFPRAGYDHSVQHVWEGFLRGERCLPAALWHPFKWAKFAMTPEERMREEKKRVRIMKEQLEKERKAREKEEKETKLREEKEAKEKAEGKGKSEKAKVEKAKDEKAKDEKTKDEKAKDEKAKDEKAKDEKAKDAKAEDEKAKDGKANNEKVNNEKAKDEKAKDEKAKDEKAKDEKAKEGREKEDKPNQHDMPKADKPEAEKPNEDKPKLDIH